MGLRRCLVALLPLCASLWAGVAHAQYVNLPGTQPGALDNGVPLESSLGCSIACHAANDPAAPGAMPYDTWLGSMMGNTMSDPLFLAALTVAEQDHQGAGDYCMRCHTPPGFVGGRTRGAPEASRGVNLTSQDREGVNCDACHRMVATTNLGNAQYEISNSETRFGPYSDISSIRHSGAASAWLSDPRMCGTCHEITNPLQPQRRADGSDTGLRLPLDTSFSEWQHSDFGVAGSPDARTCQDCHLPRIDGPGTVSSNPTAMVRERPRRHDFAGANAWGLRMLAVMRNEVSSGAFYDPTLAPYYEAGARRAEAMLRRAVTVEIREAPRTASPGAPVAVVARVTNLSGHRVPAGYVDGRRVFLTVEMLDGAQVIATVSGAYDDAQAHLDESDAQLRVYEARHGRAGSGHTNHLALNDTVLLDTRIPPRGYHPLPGHEPVGADYSGGADGALRHWDDARFTFAIPPTAHGAVTVRVRARYQSTTREYVEFLARENHTDARGQELLRLYTASGRAAPIDMGEATAVIAIPDAGVAAVDGGIDAPAATDASCGCRAGGRRTSRGALLFAALALLAARRRARASEGKNPSYGSGSKPDAAKSRRG